MLRRNVDAGTSAPGSPDNVSAEHRSVGFGLTLTTRLVIAMIMLVAIAVFAVGWLSYRSLEQGLLPRILERVEAHSKLLAADLRSHVRGARADVGTFRSRASANGIILAHQNGGIDPVDHISEAAWHKRLQTRMSAEVGAKPAYAQFRFIGVEDGGREIIRIDHSGPNGAVRIVPDAELKQSATSPISGRRSGLPQGTSMFRRSS